MKRYTCRGTITVFLSLVSVLFLSLVCTLVESARLQGARAWAAAVTDMGLFSVFGEYERELLEEYDVLFLDGAYGTGDPQPERMALRMRQFMECNADPGKGMNLPRYRNLFPMEMQQCKISGCTLATDEGGGAFYQQVVGNIRENLGTELLLKYQKLRQEAGKQKEAADAYEEKDRTAWRELEELEKNPPPAEESAEPETTEETPPATEAENPLEEIKKIKKLGILGLVLRNPAEVSAKSVSRSGLPSGRELQKGTLPVKEKYSGIAADTVFQEYLLGHFGTFRNPEKEGGLEYGIEYILAGKDSDEENLKAVVNRLLLIREGANFAYAVSDVKMRSQVSALALSIAGAVPVPGAASALEAVLLLAWAYGESLLDVRSLMSGGHVPAVKDASTWKLSLTDLARVTELLKECDNDRGTGQDYVDYLRIFLLSGTKGRYPLRALDLMESHAGQEGMRADAWVVKTEAEVSWKFPEIFLRVPNIFLHTSEHTFGYEVKAVFGY